MKRNVARLPLLLALAGQAWSQCSITSGGACSGTCPKGQVCSSDGTDSYSCSCQAPKAKLSPLGSLFDATGGFLSFDGTSLSVGNMTITDVYDKSTQTYINDPIIGSQIIFPSMTFAGLDNFDNGVTQFQYYDFKDLSGQPFEIVNGSDVLLSATIDDTWFMLNTNSFSGNDLTNITYDASFNSQFLSQFLEYSSIAQPATVVASSTDFLAGSAAFTQAYSTAATEAASECASTPEPQTWLLSAIGLLLLASARRRIVPRLRT